LSPHFSRGKVKIVSNKNKDLSFLFVNNNNGLAL